MIFKRDTEDRGHAAVDACACICARIEASARRGPFCHRVHARSRDISVPITRRAPSSSIPRPLTCTPVALAAAVS